MHLCTKAVLNTTEKQALQIQYSGFFFQNESISSLLLRESFSGISDEFETEVLKQYQVFDCEEIIGFSNKKKMLLHFHLS